jgi:hypothetical protein
MAPALPAPLAQMAPAPTTNPAEDADINTQINYIKKLLQKGRRFLIVPLDEDDDDDDKEEEAAEEDPLDTEESHFTTEGDIPDKVVGQIFVKTLSGKTITVNDVTTKTKIIDIKNAIEEKDGLPVTFQRLCYQSKKVKNNHTVGFYGIQKEHELHLMGRLRGGGRRAASGASRASANRKYKDEVCNPFQVSDIERTTKNEATLFEQVFNDCVAVFTVQKVDSLNELSKLTSAKITEVTNYFATDKTRNAEKILKIASETIASTQMRKVASLIASANATYDQCFASDVWERATVDDNFDPAEFRCLLRLAEMKAKAIRV